MPGRDDAGNVETVAVIVDSGAYHAVGPPRVAAHFPMKPTESSKAGRIAARLTGQLPVTMAKGSSRGKNENGAQMTRPIQGADANEVYGFAREMADVGKRLVFDGGNEGGPRSCVLHKATGLKQVIHESHVTFQFDLEIPRSTAAQPVQQLSGEDGHDEGVHWQGALVDEMLR